MLQNLFYKRMQGEAEVILECHLKKAHHLGQLDDVSCHAPILGPTRLADPNRVPGRETQDWDSLPDFFFKTDLVPVGMAHIL